MNRRDDILALGKQLCSKFLPSRAVGMMKADAVEVSQD